MRVHGPAPLALGCGWLPAGDGRFPSAGGRGLSGKHLAPSLVCPSDKPPWPLELPSRSFWEMIPMCPNVLQWLLKRTNLLLVPGEGGLGEGSGGYRFPQDYC